MSASAVRRWIGVGLVVSVLPAGLLLASSQDPSRSAGPPPPSAEPSRTAAASPTPTPSPTPTAATPTPASTGAPRTGPGITTAGVTLVATLDADGSFRVDELVLLDEPRSELTLAPPEGPVGAPVDGPRPAATDVQVVADGQPAGVPDGVVQDPVSVRSVPSYGFELRYRLSGVSVRSEPSSTGRALAVIAPLTDDLPPSLPVQVVITGAGIRNVYCPLLPVEQATCAAGEAPRIEVARPLEHDLARVQVQFDLGV